MNLFSSLQSLSGVKKELFRKLLNCYDIGFDQLPITRGDRRRDIPLSYIQQSLFFLNQMSPESGAYNIERAIRLKGQLNIEALSQAINTILQRHSILRTYCELSNDTVCQHIAEHNPQQIEIVDLLTVPADQKSDELLALALAEATTAFDLTSPSLFRTKLYRLEDDEHVLLIVMHHLVIDGMSEVMLAKEIKQTYEAVDRNRPLLLPELIIDYPDYVLWERIRVDYGFLDHQIEFWKNYLKDVPPLLNLPVSKPRPKLESFRGNSLHFSLEESLTIAIKRLSEDMGNTIFMTLLAAYQILLHRYSRQDLFVVATAVSSRGRPELENVIGCFANNVVIKADLSGDLTFVDFVSRASNYALDSFANQDLPFEKLVEEIRPDRDLSHNPVFQAGFELHHQSFIENLNIDGLDVSELKLEKGSAMYDLDISMVSGKTNLSGTLEFNTDIFEPDLMVQIKNHFINILSDIVKHPHKKISELAMQFEGEIDMLLQDWSGSASECRLEEVCVHQMIEQWVAATPDAIAVAQDNNQLTYRQLNDTSNRLANYLVKVGIKPGQNIGMCIERSPETIVAILGILKAGCTYAPLDANYPLERLRYYVHKAEIRHVIGRQSLVEMAHELGTTLISIDGPGMQLDSMSSEVPVIEAAFENSAYIIFTSGSTGQPKAVSITHRNLSNYIRFYLDKIGITPEERVLQFSSISFDASIEEIFATLCGGGTLILRDEEMIAAMDVFIDRIAHLEISTLGLTTAYWHEMVTVLEKGAVSFPACVKKVIIGGEKALAEKFRSWTKIVGRDIPLFNAYGPTETTISATYVNLSGLDLTEYDELPIGKPVGNTSVYILDAYLKPVPVGVPGELHIGGVAVARGYYNDQELTAEKFILNPFDGNNQSRLYKTGDLARFRRDGNLEYVGRIDSQVKVRGFRVEIGEIESTFLRLDKIKQVVVVNLEIRPGEFQLAAYIVVDQEKPVSLTQVRKDIRKQLPNHMIPQHIVEVREIPTTLNGKVDIKALPSPLEMSRAVVRVAPRNSIESEIANIWADTLQIDKSSIGVHDNFFDIGGNSLASMRVISGIYEKTGIRLNPRLIVLGSLEQIASECGVDGEGIDLKAQKTGAQSKSSRVKAAVAKLFNT